MRLTPRYGDRPVLAVELIDDGSHPVMRQRRRLEAALRDLSLEEWQHASRCEGWTVQDVVTHLASTNTFWSVSINAGLAGEPTRFLATFDPVASPAELVARSKGVEVAQTLDDFSTGNDALELALASVDGTGWDVLAEAPPGHLPMRSVVDHALWDSWVHERDILLPLGRRPVVEVDEVRRCLRYSVGLGRAFALVTGDDDTRTMVVEVDDPSDRVVVVADGDRIRVHGGDAPDDALHARGDAVTIVEHLSRREIGVEPPAGLEWLTDGLAVVFDQAASG